MNISIDVTPEEHQKIKVIASQKGKSVEDYVIESALGSARGDANDSTLKELESFLNERIRKSEAGGISRRTVNDIFEEAIRDTPSR